MNQKWVRSLSCGVLLAMILAAFTQAQEPGTAKPPIPGKPMAVDLGAEVTMEFVWVEPLKMWVGKYEVTNGEMRRFIPKWDSGGGLCGAFQRTDPTRRADRHRPGSSAGGGGGQLESCQDVLSLVN